MLPFSHVESKNDKLLNRRSFLMDASPVYSPFIFLIAFLFLFPCIFRGQTSDRKDKTGQGTQNSSIYRVFEQEDEGVPSLPAGYGQFDAGILDTSFMVCKDP